MLMVFFCLLLAQHFLSFSINAKFLLMDLFILFDLRLAGLDTFLYLFTFNDQMWTFSVFTFGGGGPGGGYHATSISFEDRTGKHYNL